MKNQIPRKGPNIILLLAIAGITFLSLLSNPCPAQTKPNTTGYTELLKQADQALAAKDYATALMLFEKASFAKPELKYASEKITEINTILDENKGSRAILFEDLIIKAENFFKIKDYPGAKAEYQKALSIDPSAQFPKDRLKQISAVYTDPADQEYFNDAVANGDRSLAAKDFDKAVLFYETALAVKPDAKAVKDKITNTKKQQSEFKIKAEQSAKIIAAADKLLQAEKRAEALAEYKKALELTPANQHAAAKISEIEKYLADTKTLQDTYDKSIEQADQFYINRDFASARLKYQEALKSKPEARYPKEMLEKTKSGESQLQSDQQKYEAALASAENLFNTGDYEAALIGFKSALSINPAETYPKTRITEIEKLITERTSRKEAYEIAIKNGDQSLGEKKYDPALSHYRNALSLLPGEAYPKQKIDEITALVALQKSLDENYKKSIADADKLFTQNSYAESIVAYTKALELKPDETYPQQKITEAQNQLALFKSKDENYASAIKSADTYFAEQKYDEALAEYKQAITIKPSEKYPQDKSAEISKILAKRKTDADKYTVAISKGDKALETANYPLALTSYQEALALKPSEQYPQDKIAEINAAVSAQKITDEKYNTAIKTGDQLFANKEYNPASAAYTEASELKKNEKYPQDQLAKINKILSEERSSDENYTRAITEGDANFADQKLAEAITSYKTASGIKPAESYPKSQIEKINTLIAEQKKLAVDYAAAIASADKLFTAAKYDDAIADYRKALDLKPSEKYPSDKITEAEKMIADAKALQESYDKAVADGDTYFSTKDLTNSLASFKNANSIKPSETYPKQKITEIQAILDKDKAEGQRYQEAIAQADKLFTEEKYQAALEPYQRASGIKPGETYPKDQVTKINQLIAEQKKLDEDYQKLITDADVQFKATKYEDARSLYVNAGALKPAEKMPKDKIAEIDALLADLLNKEQSFAKHINDGDTRFSEKQYTEAISSYNSALKIKPAETYPKSQIEKINTLIAEQKKLAVDYAAAIASADKLFTAAKYDDAIADYRKALDLKPSEKYPSDKITEAEKMIADAKALQESYDKAVADGDTYFSTKDLTNSLASFKNANSIKPSETYPKQKITEIQAILDKDKAEGQRYQEAIAQADKLFTEQKYEAALDPYQRASDIKPAETYPKDQITKINQLIADQKKLDENYQKLITDADVQFKATKYEDARSLYVNAGALKPAEKLPKDRIAEIDGLLAGIQQKELNYTNSIKEADAFFSDRKYTDAIVSYNNALAVKPAESYPKSQVEKINILLAEQKKLDSDYLTILAAADKLFDENKYSEAITDYRKALTLKPSEKYPSDKITESEKLIADLKALQQTYDKAVAEGDKKLTEKDYENALIAFKNANTAKPSETYPPQKITEIQTILDKNKAENDRYNEAIAAADKFFTGEKYREALEPYQRANTIKPAEKYPQEQIDRINQFLAEQNKLDEDYQKLITDATVFLKNEKYNEARNLYTNAGVLKPSEQLPKDKIAEIDTILAGIKLKEENYTKAINTASEQYGAKKLSAAIKSYEEALGIKPAEKYPQERITAIKSEIKAIDDKYSEAITLGDSKLASKELMEAMNAYQNALEIKPSEEYPKTKLAEINTALAAQKEELEKMYASYIADGDRLAVAKDYSAARSAFTKATGIKPTETYPKQRITEINKITEEIELAQKAEYTKALGEADKLYNSKIFDQAIDAYEAASQINQDDPYPLQQISVIRKYMSDHAIQDLFADVFIITEGTEKKFTFSSIEPRLRKNNYILLKARSAGKSAPKVYLNYGKDNQKNGGIVLRSLDKNEIKDYLIRISVQDKWYREDNNWISLFVETGDIEISKVQIAAGDE